MTNNNEKRKAPRYDAARDVAYSFAYPFESPVELTSGEPKAAQKFKALTENVSIEGLCFKTDHILKQGDILTLDVYVPGDDKPVHMHGRVCWSCPEKGSSPQVYKTGVMLTDVEGAPVSETIRFDEQYHVYWSSVLESIIGKFRILQQKPRQS